MLLRKVVNQGELNFPEHYKKAGLRPAKSGSKIKIPFNRGFAFYRPVTAWLLRELLLHLSGQESCGGFRKLGLKVTHLYFFP